MAIANISALQELLLCPLCLGLLKDPVTIPCGRSFCKLCINGWWDQEHVKDEYSCPQCKKIFRSRSVQRRSVTLSKKVKELKEILPEAAFPAQCYAGPGDVVCDSCIGRTKRKAVKSCLVCQASYCEDHLKPHYQSPAFKKHKLVEPCVELQEKICSQHDRLMEIYCRTDQSFICYLCTMDEHKGHDTVSTRAERTEKLNELKEQQMKFQQRIQEEQKNVQELKSLSNLKKQVEEICEEKCKKFHPQATEVPMILSSESESREDFLQYFCYLTLDPNTVNSKLILSEKNRAAIHTNTEHRYPSHPDRFNSYDQVLCKESVCGRCYWEVEWSGSVSISVSYKKISRKGRGYECLFGYNSQSWSLRCSSCSLSLWHDNKEIKLPGPASSRIGVYVDHGAGTLSFYSVSETMKLLRRVHTTFTQPLYAGFRIWYNSTMRLCDKNEN